MRSLRLIGGLIATLALLIAVAPTAPTEAASHPAFDFPWANTQTHTWTSGPHGLRLKGGYYNTCLPGGSDKCADQVSISLRAGLDFGQGGWQVRPVAAGVVIYKGLLPVPLGSRILANGSLSSGFGYGIVIDHGAYQTIYAHLDPASVAPKAFPQVGSQVTRSNVIGLVGCSGVYPCAKHLHLELRRGMNARATGAAFYGTPVSWDGWTIGGWTIKALALNYNGSATRCGTTVEAQANGSVKFTAGQKASCSTPTAPPPPAAVPPPAPTNITASGQDSSHIRITWTDNSGGQAAYQVNRGGPSQWVLIADTTPGTTSYTDGGLIADVNYQYYICAFNSAGVSCPASGVFGRTQLATNQPPTAPTNLTAVALDANRIQLHWTDTSKGAAQFHIFDGNALVANVSAGTAYLVTGLPAGSSHCYQVNGFDLFGTSSMSNTACATTSAPSATLPAAPTNATATALSATTVRVAWTDNATNETGFRVTDSLTTQVVGQNSAGGYTYFDFPTKPSTWECFSVQAFNSAGSSAWTPWTPCLTTPPAAASWSVSLVASTLHALVGDTVTLTAAANQPLPGGYHLEIRHVPGDLVYAVCNPGMSPCTYYLTWPMQGGTQVYAALLNGSTVITTSTPFWVVFSAPG
jgi:hypothetical protein